ncbi:MAG TPA: hypothetical protein VJB62_03745 [Patescibacteria group bacterium]|nr:hypothetical protein [Patescibacteria group bacterium]
MREYPRGGRVVMSSSRKWIFATLTVVVFTGTIYGLAIVLYGPKEGSWTLPVAFLASCIEWGVNTFWVLAVAKDNKLLASMVTFVNCSAGMVMVALFRILEIYNPDGIPFLILGIATYGLGGATGTVLVMSVRSTRS